VLPLDEVHILELAVDLAVDRDGVGCLYCAEPGQIDRQVASGCNGDGDRHAGAGRSAWLGFAGWAPELMPNERSGAG